MKIAIIGAGMAGLATCWHLLSLSNEVTLFDDKGIGGGASAVSTGLLHPFPGKSALRSTYAATGMEETKELLKVSEAALGRVVDQRTGLFRLAISEQQRRDFKSIGEDDDVIWQKHPIFGEGIWIPQAITVYSRLYLEGLWKGCRGAILEKQKIRSLAELYDYDQIVITAGAESVFFDVCKHLPLKKTKGQTLLCRWREPLPFSVSSLGHISPTEHADLCQIGSTYERHFLNDQPDEKALELKKKVALFYPSAADFEVVEARAGIRISPVSGYLPIVSKLNEKVWVFTGLGSRGLLYHSLFGKRLAETIVKGGTIVQI